MSNITVKEIICENIQRGVEIPTIIKRVKKKLPLSKVNAGQVKFYANYLFNLEIISLEQKAKYVGKRGRPKVIIYKLENENTITNKLKSLG